MPKGGSRHDPTASSVKYEAKFFFRETSSRYDSGACDRNEEIPPRIMDRDWYQFRSLFCGVRSGGRAVCSPDESEMVCAACTGEYAVAGILVTSTPTSHPGECGRCDELYDGPLQILYGPGKVCAGQVLHRTPLFDRQSFYLPSVNVQGS